MYQCECYLRKDRADGKIEYYDVTRRIEMAKGDDDR
jgi:hypothetical protein